MARGIAKVVYTCLASLRPWLQFWKYHPKTEVQVFTVFKIKYVTCKYRQINTYLSNWHFLVCLIVVTKTQITVRLKYGQFVPYHGGKLSYFSPFSVWMPFIVLCYKPSFSESFIMKVFTLFHCIVSIQWDNLIDTLIHSVRVVKNVCGSACVVHPCILGTNAT
jgi:hypothetical protein